MRLLLGSEDGKPGQFKMAVEGEGGGDALSAHQGEAEAVHEADPLIRELLKQPKCGGFISPCGADDPKLGPRVEESPGFRRGGGTDFPGQERDRLHKNRIARHDPRPGGFQTGPELRCLQVVLITAGEAGHPSPGIDKDRHREARFRRSWRGSS